MKKNFLLGISCFYHDSAAAIIEDGNIIAAVQEERFSRIKHDSSFPNQSIEYCLNAGNISIEELDHVVFYEKPFLKFDRLLETYLSFAPYGLRSFMAAMPQWLKEKLHKHTTPTNNEKRRIKLKYIVQSNTRPPTIKIFTSHNGIVSKSYKRYLENSFREDFGLLGTPIRIIFKSGDNPFTFSKR